jgi:uncharacterized protein YkwD
MAVCAVLIVSAPSLASALDTSTRPASAIQRRWSELKPSYTGSPYAVAASTSAPYATGSLNAAFLQDGLNSINYARFLTGLPDDVVLDATYTDRAQHGAVLLASSTFSHTPPKPADMDQAFYDLGYGATSQSNIGWGYSSLAQCNSGCLDDSDTSNIDRLGHRRWLLDPPLKKTGMGYAGSRSDTFVFDWSRTKAVDYDSVKWPCAGYFPVEMLGTSTAWSVTLNPARYSWTAGRAGHTVTLRRARDGRTWTFTDADRSTSGKYFNFETSGYGVNNCFVFRPDAATLGSYQVGDVFDVTISGGITLKNTGAPATISYRTEFMSHNAPSAPDVTPPATTSDAMADYAGTATIHLSVSDNLGGSGVAHTYYRLDGGAEIERATVAVTALGAHTLEFWSVDVAGNAETPHKSADFTVTSAAQSASITIKTTATTTDIGKTPILSGAVTPLGMIGRNIVVYVMKPGKTYWTYSSNRTTYTLSGGAAWLYKYYFKTGMAKGIYKFKAVVPAWRGFPTSTSPTIVSIRVR